MKKILSFMLAAVICFSLAACTDNKKDSSSSGADDKKPGALVDQDLSMFDTVKHFGIEQVAMYTLTIKGDNASFTGGAKTARVAVKAGLPGITMTSEGEYIEGIKYVKTGKVVKDFRFRMPEEDCEIEVVTTTTKPPYFKQLSPGIESGGNEFFDVQSYGDFGAITWKETTGLFANTPLTMNRAYSMKIEKKSIDVKGSNGEDDFLTGNLLRLTGVAGNGARMLTGASGTNEGDGIVNGQSYTFTYNFENFGEKQIKFRAYQVQRSVAISSAVVVNAGKDITLNPGESVSKKIAFTATSDNKNIIPMIEMRSDFDDALLGIAISKENSELKCTHKIEKVEAKDGDCGYAGNKEYYGCELCGGMWSDADGQNKVGMLDVMIKKAHTAGKYTLVTEDEHCVECSVCRSAYLKEAHTYSYVTVKEPTETQNGLQEEMCACGHKTGNSKEFSGKHTVKIVTESGEKTFSVNVDGKLPAEAKTYLGERFFDVSEPTVIYSFDEFRMPAKDMTLKKISESKGTRLTPCSGTTGPNDRFPPNAPFELTYHKTSAVNDGNRAYLGEELCFTPLKKTTITTRPKSGYGESISVDNVTFYVTVENRSGRDIRFNIAQVNSGINKIDGAKEDNVTLKAGESRTFTFTFPSGVGSNDNALTLFEFLDETDQPIVIGYALSYEKKA